MEPKSKAIAAAVGPGGTVGIWQVVRVCYSESARVQWTIMGVTGHDPQLGVTVTMASWQKTNGHQTPRFA
jgi:hypothetical protein